MVCGGRKQKRCLWFTFAWYTFVNPRTKTPFNIKISITDSKQIQNCRAYFQDCIMCLFLAGEYARQKGMSNQTQDERSRSWRRLVLFLDELKHHNDSFLQKIEEPWCRSLILAAFAKSIREARFSYESFVTLAEGTVRSAADNVAHTFRANNRSDPRVNNGGSLCHILH